MAFQKTYMRFSKLNGPIVVSASAGAWEVFVDGTRQTSARYGAMWADAFDHCKKHIDASSVKQVLMFGLAAGGAVATVYESFPGATLAVVEHDEEMVKIATELALYAPHPQPNICIADAKDAAKKLLEAGKRFELIIVDIFTGSSPSPLVWDTEFLHCVRALSAQRGVAAVNVSGTGPALDAVVPAFAHHALWKYDLNHFGAFWE
jgi:spermidine synthase